MALISAPESITRAPPSCFREHQYSDFFVLLQKAWVLRESPLFTPTTEGAMDSTQESTTNTMIPQYPTNPTSETTTTHKPTSESTTTTVPTETTTTDDAISETTTTQEVMVQSNTLKEEEKLLKIWISYNTFILMLAIFVSIAFQPLLAHFRKSRYDPHKSLMVSNLTQQDALKDMFRFDPDLVHDDLFSDSSRSVIFPDNPCKIDYWLS